MDKKSMHYSSYRSILKPVRFSKVSTISSFSHSSLAKKIKKNYKKNEIFSTMFQKLIN